MLTRRTFLTSTLPAAASVCVTKKLDAADDIARLIGAGDDGKSADILGTNSLKAHARAHKLHAGTAVDVRILKTDARYRKVLGEQYDMVVAEREMKWKPLRPAIDRYFFDDADALMSFAAQNHMLVRGHNFVWHQSIPDWFATQVTKDNAEKVLVDHISTVGARYRGKVHSWDVVNEAVLPSDGRADGLRNSQWMQWLGPEYIDIAFRAARKADPHALLTYNEYGVEYDNAEDAARRAVTLDLLRRMQKAKVPLDAVGIQSHIKAGSPNTIGKGLSDFMTAVRGMGLEIYVTELDVNEDDIASNDVAVRDQAVAETYRQYLSVALANPAVKAVLTWGVSDNHTWLNDGPTHKKKQPDRPQRSLPFDADYKPTPAFFSLRDALDRQL